MNIKRIITALILSIVIYSCEKNDAETLEDKEISYQVLEKGSFDVSKDNTINEQYLVFKSEEEWSSFISLMEFKSPEKAKEFEKIDFNFSDKTLIIITAEYDNTCCKEIKIKKVYRDKGRIYVEFETENGNGTETNLNQAYILFEVNKD